MAAGKQDAAATSSKAVSSGRLRLLYGLLLFLRFACVLLPGYIHPDEFYQGGQELFFGVPLSPSSAELAAAVGVGAAGGNGGTSWFWSSQDGRAVLPIVPTWEFDPQNAIRSIVPPLFMTALPLKLYASVFLGSGGAWSDQLSGFEIWIIPRLFLVLLSVIAIDLPCHVLINRCNAHDGSGNKRDANAVLMGLLVLASSWPALTFLCRPFTNTLEAMALSVLLVFVSDDRSSKKRSLLVGVLSSIGLFVRFTFAFFALPPVMMHLLKKGSFGRIIGHGILVMLGFVASSLAFIAADTMFYSQLSSSGPDAGDNSERAATTGGGYVTPLNALLYNSNVDNLGEHGIHPRITHLAVNLSMLFGPLAFLFYADVAASLGGLLRATSRRARTKKQHQDSSIRTMCQSAIVSGLFVLSCAPHQEPRFLLPAIVPLVTLYGKKLTDWRFTWALFNFLLVLFFGLLHQSGVVPSLLASNVIAGAEEENGSGHKTATFVYHHTYMPPSFLTRSKCVREPGQCPNGEDICSAAAETRCFGYRIIDLMGTSPGRLQHTLENTLKCENDEVGLSEVYVTAPFAVRDMYRKLSTIFHAEVVHSYWPHISTEDMPPWEGGLTAFANSLHIATLKFRSPSKLIPRLSASSSSNATSSSERRHPKAPRLSLT